MSLVFTSICKHVHMLSNLIAFTVLHYEWAQACVSFQRIQFTYNSHVSTRTDFLEVHIRILKSPWRALSSVLFGEGKKYWPNHWTVNLVSVAFAGPFITLHSVILGTPERLNISSRRTAPPLHASIQNRSLILPPAKAPSAPLCTPKQQKILFNLTHSQANLECNSSWQFVSDTGISAWYSVVICSS